MISRNNINVCNNMNYTDSRVFHKKTTNLINYTDGNDSREETQGITNFVDNNITQVCNL